MRRSELDRAYWCGAIALLLLLAAGAWWYSTRHERGAHAKGERDAQHAIAAGRPYLVRATGSPLLFRIDDVTGLPAGGAVFRASLSEGAAWRRGFNERVLQALEDGELSDHVLEGRRRSYADWVEFAATGTWIELDTDFSRRLRGDRYSLAAQLQEGGGAAAFIVDDQVGDSRPVTSGDAVRVMPADGGRTLLFETESRHLWVIDVASCAIVQVFAPDGRDVIDAYVRFSD